MSDQVLKDSITAMKAVREENAGSKEKALAFLVKAGIATQSGQLTEPYKQSA